MRTSRLRLLIERARHLVLRCCPRTESRVRPLLLVTGFWTTVAVAGVLLAAVPWLWWNGGTVGLRVPPTLLRHLNGAAYAVPVWPMIRHSFPERDLGPGQGYTSHFFRVVPDSNGESRSTLELFEDGRPLGPAHASDSEVGREGTGRFAHRPLRLVISTSDNSDPRANGRIYTFRGLSQPRLEPVRIAMIAVPWLAASVVLVFVASRWRRILCVVEESHADSMQALATLFLVATFSGYAFLFSDLLPDFALQYLVFLAVLGALFLVVSHQRLVFRKWMAWPAAFLVYSVGCSALTHSSFASWSTSRDVILSTLLGVVVLSAMHRGLNAGPRFVGLGLSVLCPLVALVILVQNWGFDLKSLVARLDGARILPWSYTEWNQKYQETWLLVLTWGVVALISPRRRKEWLVAGAVSAISGAAILSGYSYATKVTLLAGVAVFVGALRFPRAVRLGATAVSVAVLLLSPLVAGHLRRAVQEHTPLVRAQAGAGVHLARRLIIWEYSSELIGEHPWLGWGFGATMNLPGQTEAARELMAARPELPASVADNPPLAGGHPHSLPLLIWLDTGVIGAVLAAGFLVAVFRRLGKLQSPTKLGALLALLISLLLVFGLNYPTWDPALLMLLAISVGLVSGLVESTP